jgi:non-heme chloroperoxidase
MPRSGFLAKDPDAERMTIVRWVRKLAFARREPAKAKADGTGLNWSTLLRYARAAKEFGATPPVSLPLSTFDRLAGADHAEPPRLQMFECADGGHLGYRHYPLQEGNGPIVVLLHGSAGHAGQLHSLARAIAEAGRGEVYTLDLRGHGSSPGRRGHAVGHIDRLCADLGEFVQFLDRRWPLAPIVLGGHSAGGGLVLRFCRSPSGRRVSGCLFLAPYLGLGSPTMRPLFGGWVSLRAHRLRALALANVLGISWFNETTIIGFNLGALARDPAYTPSWSFNTMLGFGPGLWSTTAPAIDSRIPVLSVCGDRDECFFPDAYPEAFRTVAPQAEVKLVADCGHWDILVDDRVLKMATDWLLRWATADAPG